MKVKQTTLATVSSPSAKGNEPSMLISTVTLDRDGDVIVPEGGDFKAYLRNPVVGFQHFRTDPLPIGSTTRLDVEPGKGIRATWRWLEGDPLADRVRNAYQQGVLRAASIGFTPTKWSDIGNGRRAGRLYEKWELAEWSLVAVPSNRESVRVLRELDLWDDEEILSIEPQRFNVSKREVREMVDGVTRRLVRRAVSRQMRAALRYARGRV